VTKDGEGKLADFGLAQTKEDTRSTSGIFVTPLYAAPETVQGIIKPGSPLADIYSFGCTLFHLLAGVPPFPGSDPDEVCRMHTTHLAPKLETRVSGLPKELYELVDQCLLKKRSKRPHDWKEISQRLYGLLEGHKGYKPKHKVIHVNADEHIDAVHSAAIRYRKSKKNGAKLTIVVLFVIAAILGSTYALLKQEDWRSAADFKKVQAKVPTYVSPETAVKHIRRYINHYGEKAVPEAHELLLKYEEKALQSEDK